MKTLQQAIFDSQQRVQNFKDAVVLGLFGNDRRVIYNNVRQYNQKQERLINEECRAVQIAIKHGGKS